MNPFETDKSVPPLMAADDALRDALLHLATDAAAALDAAGRVKSVNSAMEGLFGRRRSELVDCPVADFFPGCRNEIAACLKNVRPLERDAAAVDSNGREVTVRLSMLPALDKDGVVLGWAVSAARSEGADTGQGEGANHLDRLTNIADATFVCARLKAALVANGKAQQRVSVYCIDIDGFKRVNREYGRAAGDEVLIEIARRIGNSMRASNVVGRLNEDMFAVVVTDTHSDEQITAVASRLTSKIAEPLRIKGVRGHLMLTASVGIAVAPEDGSDAETLVRNAQTAVDLAKRTGAGTYQFYTNETGGEVRERRSRINRLRRAIDDGQLELRYQPKISLVSGKIVGAEALVRWRDPQSGLVMPGDFIPLAEDAGLIDPLGMQVLEAACRALKGWQDAGLPNIRLGVNVSAREVARPSFHDDINRVTKDSGILKDSLELELTESSVMERAEEVIESLRKIRALGIHLTADDFGTGYASLSYLRNFPLDGIKIDTTFVADIDRPEDGGGLAAAVIAVGHSLGMNVVAEGVETAHQLDFLRQEGCDEVQGYLLSEPLTADEFRDLVLSKPTY